MGSVSGQVVLAFDDRSQDVEPKPRSMAGLNEEGFRLFYENTARRLRSYLWRMCGDPTAADDLLQEAFLRLLRTELPEMDELGGKTVGIDFGLAYCPERVAYAHQKEPVHVWL